MILDSFGKALTPKGAKSIDKMMTQPISDMRFTLAMERGEVREAMGISFLIRLERLVNELLGKLDCPSLFWIIYSAKWDDRARTIRELWQVTDQKPSNHMLGQAIYEIDKSGRAECWALPLDIPVPDDVYEGGEYVLENAEYTKNLPFSDQAFEKI